LRAKPEMFWLNISFSAQFGTQKHLQQNGKTHLDKISQNLSMTKLSFKEQVKGHRK